MKCDRTTLKLPEKIENADGTACAELLALRGHKFDKNRPLCRGKKTYRTAVVRFLETTVQKG